MFPCLVFLYLLLGGAALAQEVKPENESQGMKRILNPTLNPATDLQSKSFYGGADKGFSSSSSQVKSFQWDTLFRLRPFGGSKDFASTKYWTGNYAAGNGKARTKGDYEIPKISTRAEVKTNPVNEDRDARKTKETQDFANNRPFLVPGKSQKVLNSQQALQKPLTVDEVKKIINTSR